jgi:hypothetical protein
MGDLPDAGDWDPGPFLFLSLLFPTIRGEALLQLVSISATLLQRKVYSYPWQPRKK